MKLRITSAISRVRYAAFFGLMLAMSVATSVMAAPIDDAEYDWSAALSPLLVGFLVGAIATVTAVFGIAVVFRLSKKAARIALTSLGFIK